MAQERQDFQTAIPDEEIDLPGYLLLAAKAYATISATLDAGLETGQSVLELGKQLARQYEHTPILGFLFAQTYLHLFTPIGKGKLKFCFGLLQAYVLYKEVALDQNMYAFATLAITVNAGENPVDELAIPPNVPLKTTFQAVVLNQDEAWEAIAGHFDPGIPFLDDQGALIMISPSIEFLAQAADTATQIISNL